MRSFPEILPVKRHRSTAVVASLALHLTLLATLLIWCWPSQAGTDREPTRTIGLAVIHPIPDRTRYESPQLSVTESDATASAATTSQEPPASVTPPLDLAAILNSIADPAPSPGVSDGIRFSDGRSAEDLGDAELVPGSARRGAGAGQTEISLFGVSGTGSTFVYVFDRSDSMNENGGAPLRLAKSELIASLSTLSPRQQFQIIVYNDVAKLFSHDGSTTRLLTGDSGTLDHARRYVLGLTALGNTAHEPALKLAIRMAPDVIFFLTDARIQTMSLSQLDDITRRAESSGTAIHAIQFGTGPEPGGESFAAILAKKNRGKYRYVDVTSP